MHADDGLVLLAAVKLSEQTFNEDIRMEVRGGALKEIRKELVIGRISKEDRDGSAVLTSAIEVVDGFAGTSEVKHVEFSVASEYSDYLLTERCDAFVVLLLRMAVSKGFDIRSDVPISNDLYYNLKEQFLPPYEKNDGYSIKLFLKPASSVGGGTAVGTGLSCGVDSLHSVMKHIDYPDEEFRLTHLCINNVGAFNEIYRLGGVDNVRKGIYARARKAAADMGLPLVETDSNVDEVLHQNHYFSHSFTSAFAIFCLKKLWKYYFYASSGVDYVSGFSLKNHLMHSSSRFELLTADCLSTSSLRIYIEAPTVSRFDKIVEISDFVYAQRYLTSCTNSYDNCCRCDKCTRNIMTLDAIDRLDRFSEVYDIGLYESFRDRYMWYLYSKRDDSYFEPVFYEFESKNDEAFLRVGQVFEAASAFDAAWRSGSPKSIKPAFERLLPFADEGEMHAAFRVARSYNFGKGVKKDRETAVRYWMISVEALRAEVENGFTASRIKLFDLFWSMEEERCYPEMMSLLEPLLEVGDMSAMIRMGRACRYGKGAAQDTESALTWFREAVAKDPAWLPELCDLLLSTGDEECYKEAMDRCLERVDKGSKHAFANIARMYRDGKGVDKDLRTAAKWMRRAVDSNLDGADLELFDILWAINDPTYDRGLLNLARPRAENESIPFMGRLGRMYRQGRGVDRDVHIAVKWLEKAADLDPFWTVELCEAVVESDSEEARQSLLARVVGLCEDDSKYGYMCMGRLCHGGIAVEKDLLAAADWYRKAAESMDSAALELFDVLWSLNDDENNREMMNIAYRLAESGNSGGMGRLGNIYRYGRGVPKNLVMAERWMSKAYERDPARWRMGLEAIREAIAEECGDVRPDA